MMNKLKDLPAIKALPILKVPKVQPGMRPGALGEDADAEVVLPSSYIVADYDEAAVEVREYDEVQDALKWAGSDQVTWVHVVGDPVPSELRALREAYGLHPLAVEDVFKRGQRAKQEDYDGQLFTILNLPLLENGMVTLSQVSLFLLPNNTLLSFSSIDHDLFGLVRQRIEAGKGLIRKAGADYLFYALIDGVVDYGFPVLENYNERLEALEDAIFEDAQADPIATIHAVKKALIALRRAFWAQALTLQDLQRNGHALINTDIQPYFRDCEDHANRIMDLLDACRDMAGALLDTHLSLVSNRMNDIMKVLTLMSTIFIPLSFLVGLYGMNFDTSSPWNLPELGWQYGYVFVWSVIVVTVLGLLWVFKRKKWL